MAETVVKRGLAPAAKRGTGTGERAAGASPRFACGWCLSPVLRAGGRRFGKKKWSGEPAGHVAGLMGTKEWTATGGRQSGNIASEAISGLLETAAGLFST